MEKNIYTGDRRGFMEFKFGYNLITQWLSMILKTRYYTENNRIMLPLLNLWIGIRFSCSLDKRFFRNLFLYRTHRIT